MKKMLFVLACIVLAQCSSPSHEDMAKALIKERLRTTLPDFASYESIDYGTMGKAFLAFEETGSYKQSQAALKLLKDSAEKLQQKNTAINTTSVSLQIQQLQDSVKQKSHAIDSAKRTYDPQKLFKMAHGYKAKDSSGKINIYHTEYYFDLDFKGIVKENKISVTPV